MLAILQYTSTVGKKQKYRNQPVSCLLNRTTKSSYAVLTRFLQNKRY